MGTTPDPNSRSPTIRFGEELTPDGPRSLPVLDHLGSQRAAGVAAQDLFREHWIECEEVHGLVANVVALERRTLD
jgi:hypothetical protein